MKHLPLLDAAVATLLLIIFAGVVLHAPFSVAMTAILPGGELVWKSWKEILLGIAAILAIVLITRRHAWREVLRDRFVQIVGIYTVLHIVMAAVYIGNIAPLAAISGLLIDLRYILFFILAYTIVRAHPLLRRPFLITAGFGAILVILFGVLQATILPDDILKYIGYGSQTIMPYLTVDQNYGFIRINSTLRGPNPLGIYAAIAAAITLAYGLFSWKKLSTVHKLLGGTVIIGCGVVAWSSFSRSGLLAFGLALAIVIACVFAVRYKKLFWALSGLGVLLLVISTIALSHTAFFKTVVLHEDPAEAGFVNSNDGHIDSLEDGLNRMIVQPFGAGVGSTGSASLYGASPLIIENQYLFIAHESGWLGLFLFVLLFSSVMYSLWRRRKDWLACAMFASGIGIAVAGLVLPVWVDDTVSIIWWGLAAIAIASRKDSYERTSN